MYREKKICLCKPYYHTLLYCICRAKKKKYIKSKTKHNQIIFKVRAGALPVGIIGHNACCSLMS